MPYTNVMPQFKSGTLKSSSGDPVTNRKQAVAIMLSEKSAAEHGKEEYQPDHPMRAAFGLSKSKEKR
jgi:hypothetical protein